MLKFILMLLVPTLAYLQRYIALGLNVGVLISCFVGYCLGDALNRFMERSRQRKTSQEAAVKSSDLDTNETSSSKKESPQKSSFFFRFMVGAIGLIAIPVVLFPRFDAWFIQNQEKQWQAEARKKYNKNRIRVQDLADDFMFAAVQKSRSAEDVLKYLKNFPKGRHAKEALILLDNLSFEKVKAINTDNAYQWYLSKFPKGLHRREARNMLSANRDE